MVFVFELYLFAALWAIEKRFMIDWEAAMNHLAKRYVVKD